MTESLEMRSAPHGTPFSHPPPDPSIPADADLVEHTSTASSLPPVDRGYHAWKFVFVSFILEILFYGTGFTYGVFQEYHNRPVSPYYTSSNSAVSAIGTLVIAMQYASPALARGIFIEFATLAKTISFCCLVVGCGGFIFSSFGNHISVLIFGQGLLFGVGSGAAYTPIFLYLPHWFDKRRGLATGIIFSGAALGGVVFPLIFNKLLESVGFNWTLRIWGLIIFFLGGISIMALQPRLKPHPHEKDYRYKKNLWRRIMPGSIAFVFSPLGGVNALATLLQAAAFFSISLYVSTFAKSMGANSTVASAALSTLNAAGLFGQVVMGHLCDIVPYPALMFGAGIIGSFTTLFLLGFAHSMVALFVYVAVFGIANGGFTALWTPMSRMIATINHEPTSLMLLGFTAVRSISSFGGPLIASALYNRHLDDQVQTWGSHGSRDIVIFVGACLLSVSVSATLVVSIYHRALKSV